LAGRLSRWPWAQRDLAPTETTVDKRKTTRAAKLLPPPKTQVEGAVLASTHTVTAHTTGRPLLVLLFLQKPGQDSSALRCPSSSSSQLLSHRTDFHSASHSAAARNKARGWLESVQSCRRLVAVFDRCRPESDGRRRWRRSGSEEALGAMRMGAGGLDRRGVGY
jgi:hypothetical protein